MGNNAAHHSSANFCWQRFVIKSSALRRNNCQSSAVPSITTDGKPHFVLHLKLKKLLVMSITVIFSAIFSTGAVPENAGDSSAAKPSTTFLSICTEKQSGLPSTTDAQLLRAPRPNSSQRTSSVFFPSWATPH